MVMEGWKRRWRENEKKWRGRGWKETGREESRENEEGRRKRKRRTRCLRYLYVDSTHGKQPGTLIQTDCRHTVVHIFLDRIISESSKYWTFANTVFSTKDNFVMRWSRCHSYRRKLKLEKKKKKLIEKNVKNVKLVNAVN